MAYSLVLFWQYSYVSATFWEPICKQARWTTKLFDSRTSVNVQHSSAFTAVIVSMLLANCQKLGNPEQLYLMASRKNWISSLNHVRSSRLAIGAHSENFINLWFRYKRKPSANCSWVIPNSYSDVYCNSITNHETHINRFMQMLVSGMICRFPSL